MPNRYRRAAKTPAELLILRDFNLLLTTRNAFSLDQLGSIKLSEQSQGFLLTSHDELSLEQVVLGNRRVLEDIYPNAITRSRDVSIIPASFHRVPDLLNHKTPTGEIDIVLEDSEFEGPQVEPEVSSAESKSERIALAEYLEQLSELIRVVHSEDDLKNLPAVQSANLEEPFTINFKQPISLRYDLPGFEDDLSEADRAELQLLEENGGNPVIPK
jgi:hypothetical protein